MATAKVASYMRVEPGSVNVLPATLPSTAQNLNIDVNAIANKTVDNINKALDNRNCQAIVDLFKIDGYWRDHLALSWDLRTLKGRVNILNFLNKDCRLQKLEVDNTSEFRKPRINALDGVGEVKGMQFFVNFTTTIGTGQGVLRLAEVNGQWKIWTLFLALKEITGHEEPLNNHRAPGVQHGGDPNRKNWTERRSDENSFEDNEPAVMIVGAGQGGLAVAARLKMLNIPSLIIDQNKTVGDNWRQRYKQLVLHDPVWYDHLPYVPFPAHWPIFTPKDKLGDWFEAYAKTMELNVWMRTTVTKSSYDNNKRHWTITMETSKDDGTKHIRTLHPRHVIQATGHSGKKNFPTIKGMDKFKGDRLCHSSEFPGARPNSHGKKAIVVGACNSAHDLCQDFHEKGYHITMIQRSSTFVVSSKTMVNIALGTLYHEGGPPTEDADLYVWSIPSEVNKTIQSKIVELEAKADSKMLEGLKLAGFNTDRGPDNGGLSAKYLQRGGGYYIDVGASQLIIDGKIKIKSGVEIMEILPHGLKFADGSELEADEIVFATGYQNMRSQARVIFGDELADRVGDIWGFDAEGEMRTIWRKSGHPGFWFMGGNLSLCRYYSRILALQIKAVEMGIL